jgi:hypothetical protein
MPVRANEAQLLAELRRMPLPKPVGQPKAVKVVG